MQCFGAHPIPEATSQDISASAALTLTIYKAKFPNEWKCNTKLVDYLYVHAGLTSAGHMDGGQRLHSLLQELLLLTTQ